jgi:hypothetical protein
MLIKGRAEKCEENGAYGGNTEMIAIMVWFIKCLSAFVPYLRARWLNWLFTVGQVVAQRNVLSLA